MKFLEPSNYFDEIKKLFQNQEPLNIAVSFWGIDALTLFKEQPQQKKIKLICNLESGACNPFLIEKLRDVINIELRTNKYLHAKILLQNKSAIIGSANISSNGLLLEGNELSGWIEAGLLTCNEKIIEEMIGWYNNLWDSSDEIDNDLIQYYKTIWKIKRNQRKFAIYDLSLLEAALHDYENFIDREIYFAIYRTQNVSKEALETFETAKETHTSLSKKIDFYEGWSAIPDNAYLISIYYGPRGRFQIDGIFKTPEKALIEGFTYADGSQGEIKLCFKVKSIKWDNNVTANKKKGYELSIADKKLIKQHIDVLLNFQTNPFEPILIPFVDGICAIANKIK